MSSCLMSFSTSQTNSETFWVNHSWIAPRSLTPRMNRFTNVNLFCFQKKNHTWDLNKFPMTKNQIIWNSNLWMWTIKVFKDICQLNLLLQWLDSLRQSLIYWKKSWLLKKLKCKRNSILKRQLFKKILTKKYWMWLKNLKMKRILISRLLIKLFWNWKIKCSLLKMNFKMRWKEKKKLNCYIKSNVSIFLNLKRKFNLFISSALNFWKKPKMNQKNKTRLNTWTS